MSSESKPKYKVGDHVHIVDGAGRAYGQGTVTQHDYHGKVNGFRYRDDELRPLGTIVGETVSTESGLTGEILRYTHATDSVHIKTGSSTPDGRIPYVEFHRSFIRPVSTAARAPGPSLRDRLAECFRDYAKQAVDAHQWEAATAYLRAADIAEAFGLTSKDTK